MLGYIMHAFLLGGDKAARPSVYTGWPRLALLLAGQAVILLGLLLGAPPLVGFGGVAVAWVLLSSLSATAILQGVAGRRLACAVLPAALGVLPFVLTGLYAPDRCAVLAPDLFILLFPLIAFVVVLGARLVARVGAQESWPVPEMAGESLAGLVAIGAMLAFVLAGGWTCTPQAAHIVLYVAVLTLATVALSGLFERRGRRG